MSTAADALLGIETLLRFILPSIPAGTAGVEKGWRSGHDLQPGETPHVFLFDVVEREERLIFHQRRVTTTLKGQIVRVGSTYAQALDDWEEVRALFETEWRAYFSSFEAATLDLEDVEDWPEQQVRAVAFTMTTEVVVGYS